MNNPQFVIGNKKLNFKTILNTNFCLNCLLIYYIFFLYMFCLY